MYFWMSTIIYNNTGVHHALQNDIPGGLKKAIQKWQNISMTIKIMTDSMVCHRFTSMTFQSQFVHMQRDKCCSLRRTSQEEAGPGGCRHTPGRHSWSCPVLPTRNSDHRRIDEPLHSWK